MKLLGFLVAVALSALVLSACARTRCCPVRTCCPPAVSERDTPAATPVAETAPEPAPTPWEFLSGKYDADGDGQITPEEHGRGTRPFQALDHDEDGTITAADLDRPTRMEAYISMMTLMRYFHEDENLTTLERGEVESQFASIDTDGDGVLSPAELEVRREAMRETETAVPRMPPGVDPHHALRQVADADADGRLELPEVLAYFDGQDPDGDGAWKIPGPPSGARPARRPTGVAEGDAAPDFTLDPPGGGESVTLSTFAGHRPVALIFGSYT